MNAHAWGRGNTSRVSTRDFPAEVLALVTRRQGGIFCEDCKTLGLTTPPDVPMQIDHKQPLARGGDNHHLNLRWSCQSHNQGRAARSLKFRPDRPAWERRR